jgi:hypothetical protein
VGAGLLLGAFLVQTVTSLPAGSEVADLERIRQAIARQPAVALEAAAGDATTPVFRVSVRAPSGPPPWNAWTNVPSYIRPNMPSYHYDFMQMVTPEAFRAGTLYPVGIPIGALIEMLAKHIQTAHRKSQEQHAREEVQQALAALLACRADPPRPGC